MNDNMKIPEFVEADKVESCYHDFEKDPELVGKLIEINKEGVYGKQYVVSTPAGDVKVGTYDVLTTKITDKALNKFIKIKYLGEQTSPKTKRKYRDFDVWVKE